MSNQQENLIDLENSESNGKRPRSLNVLLILSSIYIIMSLSGTIQSLMNGPLSQDQIESQSAEFYGSISDLKEQGIGENFTDIAEVMMETTFYINNEAFYITNNLRLLELIIGAISLVFMYQLKRVGFHIYLLYSLMPIIVTYITIPQELILTVSIVFMVVIGTLFAFLYGSKLKYMK